MVCIVKKQCVECQRIFEGDAHSIYQNTCGDCKQTIDRLEKEKHLKFLSTLTIDARTRKIEEWIYDFEKNVKPKLAKKGELAGFKFNGKWAGCGTWDRYSSVIKNWR